MTTATTQTPIYTTYVPALRVWSRWFSSATIAQATLDTIPVELRGRYTLETPLQTSQTLWRVDATHME